MGLFSTKLAARAVAEAAAYAGKTETQSPLKERIGRYWAFVGMPHLDGDDTDVPWSAAFISYMLNLAGAGSQFPYDTLHAVYFYRTINDKLTKKPKPFWGYRTTEATIEIGDIVGMNRESGPAIDYDWAAHNHDYKSHADIVVDIDDKGEIHTIGGNVGHKVGKKTFVWKSKKLVNKAAPKQEVFVVIRASLP